MVYTIDMISKSKGRVIVSISKDSIDLLDRILKWYNTDNFSEELFTRSTVIEDAIFFLSEKVGVK